VILLCDEDIGTAVPNALASVGYQTISMATRGWLGVPDHIWLPTAGDKGWLVFSANKKMLLVPHERQAIIDHKVGIVFLTTGEEYIANVLKLILNRWDWLENLDALQPRPFARFLAQDGRRLEKFRDFAL
jgi:hypothetical protein